MATVALDNDLLLSCALMPPNVFGYFIASQTAGSVPNAGGSQGTLCLGGTIGRYDQQIQNSGTFGRTMIVLDLMNTPSPTGVVMIVAGQTWHFQCWYRDVVSGAATSNFSDAVALTFQ